VGVGMHGEMFERWKTEARDELLADYRALTDKLVAVDGIYPEVAEEIQKGIDRLRLDLAQLEMMTLEDWRLRDSI